MLMVRGRGTDRRRSVMVVEPASSESTAMVTPRKFAHAVLRTRSRYDEMLEWYQTVLNARIVAQAPHMAFLTYDDEHHRIAIVRTPHATPRDPDAEGLDHLSFTYGSLADLLATHARLKTAGIEPFCPVNHGPTTSLYYHDPDGNRIELQIDNFADLDQGAALLNDLAAFNPIGALVDPDELAAQLAAGATEEELVQRTAEQIGPLDHQLVQMITAH
jgi:catechol 2,3-dioxygenase-like lactoylglutathione lyase family enzyme